MSTLLAPVETAMDHIKDLLASNAFGTISAEVGDLKDGQARLGKSVNAQGKKLGELGDKLDGVGNRVGDLEGEIRQQKVELKAEIQQKNEETKQQLRQEMSQQRQELEQQIKSITLAQNRINERTQERVSELETNLELVEKRTLKNARKIFEE